MLNIYFNVNNVIAGDNIKSDELYAKLSQRFAKLLELHERRLLHHLNKILEKIEDAVKVKEAAATISQLMEKPILRDLPKATLEDFQKFDEEIANNEESQLHVASFYFSCFTVMIPSLSRLCFYNCFHFCFFID